MRSPLKRWRLTGSGSPGGKLTDQIDGDDDDTGGEGEDKNRSNRVKYTCPACNVNVWGKPNLRLICGRCEVVFQLGNTLHEGAARR